MRVNRSESAAGPVGRRLETALETLQQRRDAYLGYPVAKDFRFSALAEFLDVPLNNLGDPFSDSTWQMATREFEREVLADAAR